MMFLLLLLCRLLTLGIILWLSPEKIEKAVPFFWGRLSPRGDAVVVCVRTYVRLGDFSPVGFGLLCLFINRGVVRGLFVSRCELRRHSAVFKVYAINFFKITDTWIQWFKIRIVSVFEGQAFLDDFKRNSRRDFTSRLAALDNHCQGDFRVVVRRESDEPGVVVFL